MADGEGRSQSGRMLRRTIALALWTYFAWYLGAMIASAIGLPSFIGPAAGVAMALFAVYDWRRPRAADQRQPASAQELQVSR
jgi:hypothetical protein